MAPSDMDPSSSNVESKSEHSRSRSDRHREVPEPERYRGLIRAELIDPDAAKVLRRLARHDHDAYLVGGGVRDLLLGRRPKDYDIATSALPNEVRALFRNCRVIGRRFRLAHVLFSGGKIIETATFRRDPRDTTGDRPTILEVHDGEGMRLVPRRRAVDEDSDLLIRHDNVFGEPHEDAVRRDFTINGLFYDPLEDEVIDYIDGQQDLESGIVRAIGDPRARLDEDKLRMLRAVRFAAAFDFEIEADTLSAMQEMADQLRVVSAERIGMELRRMLVHSSRAGAVSLLADTGLLKQAIEDLSCSEDELKETVEALKRLASPSLPLALATLLNQCQPSPEGPGVARRLRFTKKEGELIGWLLKHRDVMGRAHQTPWPQVQRLLVHPGAEELLALHEAMVGKVDEAAAFCRAKLQLPPETLNPPPLVDGSDLIAHGVQPGPAFAELLDHLRDAQLEGHIADREQALTLAYQWLSGLGEPS
jgi:poly(A) polymerase